MPLHTQHPDPSHQQQQSDKTQLKEVALLPAVGLRLIHSVSSSYDTTFPPALEGVLSPEDFQEAIDRVNNVLVMYWPCTGCFLCGYLLSPCTLGLSFGCPNICVEEAEKYALRELEYINRTPVFRAKGMVWKLRKTWLQSWIVIQLPEKGPEGETAQGLDGGGEEG